MPDPRYVAAKAIDAPYWIFSPSATPSTVSFGPRFELGFTRAEFFAFLATLPDTSIPVPPPPIPEPPKPPLFVSEWRIVTTDLLNVRKAPNGAVVGTLKKGEVVQVNEGQKAGAYVWRKVVGKEWWIAQELTALTAEPNVKRWTIAIVNIRPEPGTNNTPVGSIPKGTEVTLFAGAVKKDAYTWAQLADGRGYIAIEFTEDKPPVVEPPPTPKPEPPPVIIPGTRDGYKRFGFNLCGPGSPNPLYAYQAQARQAGLIMGPCVITQEPKAVLGLDAEIVIYRAKITGDEEPSPNGWRGRRWTAQEWFDEWWPHLRLAEREPGRKLFYKFLNEIDDPAYLIPFYKALMDICRRHNPRLYMTYGDFSFGVFREPDPGWLAVMDQGIEQGHLLCGNTYWATKHPQDGTPWDEQTSRYNFEYMLRLVKHRPGIQWVHGEYGWADDKARYPGAVRFQWLLQQGKVFNMPGYEGAALWAVNGSGGGWPQSNVPESDFPALVQAVKTL